MPRGWVQTLIGKLPKDRKFRVIADGAQIGDWSTVDGIWKAESVRAPPNHTPAFNRLVPKRLHKTFINFGAYKSIQIEFDEVITEQDEVEFAQAWIAPVYAKSKELLFTNFYPKEIFVDKFSELRHVDPLQLPIVKLSLLTGGRRSSTRSTAQQTRAR